MKKNYSFIALMLFFCTTAMYAQKKWTHSEESVEKIEAGEEFNYVLKQGLNNEGLSNGYYLNIGTKGIEQLNDGCIYNFVEDGIKDCGEEKFTLYVLKNKRNGKFLSNGPERYVAQKERAFHFSARLAREITQEEIPGLAGNWLAFSNAVRVQTCPESEKNHAWVLCGTNETQRNYISYFEQGGSYPSFLPYLNTNSWLICKAFQIDCTPNEQMDIFYNEFYQIPVTEENYPIGDNPGCVEQSVFNEMLAAYNEASAAVENLDLTQADCERIKKAAIASFEKYKNERKPFTEGYYIIVNDFSRRAITVKNGETYAEDIPSTWNLDKSKFVWHMSPAKYYKGFYSMRNWGSDQYIGYSPKEHTIFPMVDKNPALFEIFTENADNFLLKNKKGQNVRNTDKNTVVYFNGMNAPKRSYWKFMRVPQEVLDTLGIKVNQNVLNKRLGDLVKSTENTMTSLEYLNGFTFDGRYSEGNLGLTTKAVDANATETREGSIEGLFDGDVNTYYHSTYDEKYSPTDDWHWVELDLGHTVQDIYIKMTDRINRRNHNVPISYAIVAPKNDDAEISEWTDTLCKKENICYSYPTPNIRGAIDSSTYVEKIVLPRPVRFIRFAVTATHDNDIKAGFAPCWNLSELHFYDAAECVENPRLNLVPNEVKEKLNKALEVAKNEITEQKATQASYNALSKALQDFLSAYPDPTELQLAIAKATEKAEYADESLDTFGYYRVGAKSQFLKAIQQIKRDVQNKILTLDEIKKFEKDLANAESEFNKSLIIPEDGKIYRIISNAGYTEEGVEYAQNGSCVASINADINGAPVWRYKEYEGVDDRFNTLWKVEKSEDGLAFKNIANGLYLNNPLENIDPEQYDALDNTFMTFSERPYYFKMDAYKIPGSLIFNLSKNRCMSLGFGGFANHLGNSDSNLSAFTFTEITDENGFTDYTSVDIIPGKTQIVTLPFNIKSAYTNTNQALKVVGLKDNFIQLNAYTMDEEIPAGTPFVVVAAAADEENGVVSDNILTVELPYSSIEDYLTIEYVRNPIVQNGLVSAPSETFVEPGFGLLTDGGKVVISAGGERILASSGFFDRSIPKTDVNGNYTMEVIGNITGEWTAIDNAIVRPNDKNDVYTISGVKVMQHANYSDIKNHLPKGVYIFGEKKIMVK